MGKHFWGTIAQVTLITTYKLHQVTTYINPTKTNMPQSPCHLPIVANVAETTGATATSRASLLSAARRQARRAAFEALAKCLGILFPPRSRHPLNGSRPKSIRESDLREKAETYSG